MLCIILYYIWRTAGKLDSTLYNTAVFGSDGVLETAKVQQKHVRQWNSKDDMLRNGGFNRKKREELGNKTRN